MAQCKYEYAGWQCPHDTVVGDAFCIFHLPVERKSADEFWGHLANYLLALMDKAGNEETAEFEKEGDAWIFREKNRALLKRYKNRVHKDEDWRFTGFEFPAMDDAHDFYRFVLGPADFQRVQFSGDAVFLEVQFSGHAYFHRAEFSGKANFSGAEFTGDAVFDDIQFSGDVVFECAQFSARTRFSDGEFSGDVSFERAVLEDRARLDFNRCTLRSRLLFEGTRISDKATVLLWSVDFAHGTSDIRMQDGHKKGEIVEPAGQIVFRDISKGMNRVSFLHTDIFTDRLLVRFSNVTWDTNPERFIFDARFVFNPISKWTEKTGLSQETLDWLPDLFSVRREPPKGETVTQEAKRKEQELAECQRLVKQDVERIAREIRRSHEEYGNYPDAGDYYIAEMDYRREWTHWYSFRWLALWLYKHVSNYGESPGQALMSLLFVYLASTLGYLLTGFNQSEHTVKPLFKSGWPNMGAPLMDVCRSLLCSVFNLVPGYFRGQSVGFTTNPALAVAEALLGVTVLTLFLLALRRRFRR